MRRAKDRKLPRQMVSRPAKIMLGDRGHVPCRMCDVSANGAMLLVSNSDWLPNAFDLVDTFSGIKRQAQVVWKAPGRIGVRFTEGPDMTPPCRSGFGRRRV
jgi:hypothetical protein